MIQIYRQIDIDTQIDRYIDRQIERAPTFCLSLHLRLHLRSYGRWSSLFYKIILLLSFFSFQKHFIVFSVVDFSWTDEQVCKRKKAYIFAQMTVMAWHKGEPLDSSPLKKIIRKSRVVLRPLYLYSIVSGLHVRAREVRLGVHVHLGQLIVVRVRNFQLIVVQ